MGHRRRHRRRLERDWLPWCTVAFGLGLLLALCASLKLVLLLVAFALIYIGITIHFC